MLTIKSVDVFYGDVQALWDVSLEISQGEIVTILGSNGAGKTTTLKTISGLLKPRKGSIVYKEMPIDKFDAHYLPSVGITMVPEGRHLFPNMTVKENLLIGAYYREARAKKDETLEWVITLFPRLKERFHQLAGTMSGGEQQMCAIGRALMARPQLLMLDEPSLGLAPNLVEMIFNTIKEINQKDKVTILLVEQNAHVALQIADRGYVLENGKVMFAGVAKDLLNSKEIQKAYLGL